MNEIPDLIVGTARTGKSKAALMQLQVYGALAQGFRVLIVDPKDLDNWELLEKATPLPEIEDDDHLGPYERPGYLRAVGDDHGDA